MGRFLNTVATSNAIEIPNSNATIPRNYYEWLKDQIDSFVSLPNNWDGYNSVPLICQIADITKQFIACLNSDLIDRISDIFSNPHGTITIEWENKKDEKLSLEIGINNYSYFIHYKNKEPQYDKGVNIITNSRELTSNLYDLFTYELPRYYC